MGTHLIRGMEQENTFTSSNLIHDSSFKIGGARGEDEIFESRQNF